MSIQKLFRKYGSDKSRTGYDVAYEFFCAHLLGKPGIRLLEIGVLHGASARVWREWFGPDANISVIDIVPENAKMAEGVADNVFVGDQSNPEFLQSVVEQTGGRWDIVIDDGSHKPSHQWTSFQVLWPHVVEDGLYIVEDTGANVGKFRAKIQGRSAMDELYEKALSNMRHQQRRPPPEFICFCGPAVFIRKIPACKHPVRYFPEHLRLGVEDA